MTAGNRIRAKDKTRPGHRARSKAPVAVRRHTRAVRGWSSQPAQTQSWRQPIEEWYAPHRW